MTTFSHTQAIAHLIIMGIGIFICLQSSFILFSLRKKHHDNTCLLFCLYISTVNICLITRLILTFLTPTIEESFVQLPPLDTVITYPAILMLTLYVIELIHPRWANWRRTLLLLSPWGLLTILLFVWQGDQIRTLHTCREVFLYLHEPNVWIRFLLTLLLLPCGIWLFVMPYNWRICSADYKTIRFITIWLFLGIIGQCINNIAKSPSYTTPFVCGFIGFICFMGYFETHIRLQAPDQPIQEEEHPAPLSPANQAPNNEVAERLRKIIEDPDTWQNPDLKQEELCRRVGTNRTYLLEAIKQLGFNSYYDMLNRSRVAFIMAELRKNPDQNIQELFYRAGYRSRATASRNFQLIAGCSPSEFIASFTNQPHF